MAIPGYNGTWPKLVADESDWCGDWKCDNLVSRKVAASPGPQPAIDETAEAPRETKSGHDFLDEHVNP